MRDVWEPGGRFGFFSRGAPAPKPFDGVSSLPGKIRRNRLRTPCTRVPYGFSRRVQRPHTRTHADRRTQTYARETSSDPFTDNNNIPTGPAEDSAGGDVNGPAAIRTGRVPIEGKKTRRLTFRTFIIFRTFTGFVLRTNLPRRP